MTNSRLQASVQAEVLRYILADARATPDILTVPEAKRVEGLVKALTTIVWRVCAPIDTQAQQQQQQHHWALFDFPHIDCTHPPPLAISQVSSNRACRTAICADLDRH